MSQTVKQLESFNYQVQVINPQLFKSFPCPSYPEIRLSFAPPAKIREKLQKFNPHAIHIATEGPLGWVSRRICLQNNFPFTTSYHTRFPEYVKARFPFPLSWSYRIVKSFHRKGSKIMVATQALKQELIERGFNNIVTWSRGVNHILFCPENKTKLPQKKPVFIYVGRVAVEKNIEAFLSLELPGSKVVVGDGPARKELEKVYPEVTFSGYKQGLELAEIIAGADVFVFPSLTDTFGVVILEAMACGLPVAAYPVTGPLETVKNGINGYLDDDLQQAAIKALDIDPKQCRATALQYSWERCSRQFLDNLEFREKPIFC